MVRLCGYTLSKLSWILMHTYRELDRELSKIFEGKGYSEVGLRAALRNLEDFANTVRFAYPACPVLPRENIDMLKQDIASAVDKLKTALEKRDAGEVQMALLEHVGEVGAVFLRLYEYFVEK